ncbi:glycosyltransferase family 2 protein [Acetobacter vaccinii]|uniref:Glycosyltransferase family 2 protein n=1 Tax=Acetobacter vaccinii TaxID=2592655 RepID=A0A5C1YMR3_9PROT|nr:glycosyltransferase [Acetobacter vaccinii]QEO16387.1 glycosyltransferase family 2 protein [Acetobacter vaccinii]
MAELPAVSIVICTYNRPVALQRLIDNCLKQASPAGLPFEIIIADNSPTGYAQALVQTFTHAHAPVRWIQASPANISIARNHGIAAAQAQIIAFLDDDMTIETGWLDQIYATLQHSGADIALSSVTPVTDKPPPAWYPGIDRFTRVLDMPDATPLSTRSKGGTFGIALATSASLWRRARCFTDAAPFDPDFGHSGGEDLDLFMRLENRQCVTVWCGSAHAREWVPAERLQFSYLFLRAFSGGQVFAAATIHNARRPRMTAVSLSLRGAGQCLAGALLVPAYCAKGLVRGRCLTPQLAHLLFRIAGAAGKCTWFRKVPLYRLEKPSQSG